MPHRRWLGTVAIAWLCVHVSVVIAGTATVIKAGNARTDTSCQCPRTADHQFCPMHGKPADHARCHLRGSAQDLSTALLSMLGPLALPAESSHTIVDVFSLGPRDNSSLVPSDWSLPPESPPPRA